MEGKTPRQLMEEIDELRRQVDQLQEEKERRNQWNMEEQHKWDRYRLISENTSDLIAVTTFSLNPTYTYVSPSHKQVLGYDPEELVGKPGIDFVHPDDKKRLLPLLKKYITLRASKLLGLKNQALSERLEYRVRDKSGDWHFLESSVNLINNEILFVSRDTTRQKATIEATRMAYAELMQIFNNIVEGVRVIDKDYNVLLVNKTFASLASMSEEEMTGKKCYEVFSCSLCHTPNCFLQRILGGESHIACDTEIRRKDTVKIPCAVTATPFQGTASEPMGIVENFRDITQRKQAEKELREANEFLEQVIENSKDGILIVDTMGNILACNTALAQMSGFSKEELMGKHSSMLVIEDREMRNAILEKTAELFEKGFATYEPTFKSKEGKHIDAECLSSMVRNAEGEYIAGVSIIRDITERKKMERHLIQSEKIKSLEELAGGVAHNFNNILAAILGRAQLLMMKFTDQPHDQERRKAMMELKKSLEVIEQAALEGARTVKQIQDFSSKREDGFFIRVNLNEIIDQSLELTRARWQDDAQRNDITIAIRKELSNLPPIEGNVSELKELFTNLFNNAFDAMPQGGELSVKTFGEDGQNVIIVQDTGAGIPEDIRDKIFDPFFTTKGVQSTGLGLSASYGIISRHRGTIRLDGMAGTGSCFVIKFPAAGKLIEEHKAQTATGKMRKASILVIEDEDDLRNLLTDILKTEDLQVEAAENGREGIALFASKHFDLVFTDLGMPEMSGWQVAKEIKKLDDRTPVALITGWHIQLNDSEKQEKGVDLIINKPFKVDEILRLVQDGLKIKDSYNGT
jgi:PAS domain S-box-containing protein